MSTAGSERAGARVVRAAAAAGLAGLCLLVAAACSRPDPLQQKLADIAAREEQVLAKIEGIKRRQEIYAQKLPLYEQRLAELRRRRAQVERQIERRTPVVIRPGQIDEPERAD